MTKQDILNTTGLSEEEFYQRYPDQEAFCSEYPEMCPDMMDDEDVSDEYVVESDYDDSLYEAEDGVETTAPYTDYNQYKNAMQTYGAESNKAATYNSFQNDLYNQSGKTRGSSETASQLGDMFNTLSPEQQDALAQKYGAQFITNTPSANRRNYVNSMEMTVPGKGTGYYSFPTNDVVYGSKNLERPNYEFPAITMAPYKMPAAPKKFSVEPTQLINSISAGYKNPAALNLNNGNLPIPKYSLSRTMEKVGATNQPFVTSTPSYSSIIDLLKARKQDSSFANRKKLAEEAGIKNYTGSASQNMDFINRLSGVNSSGTTMESGGTYVVKSGDNLSQIAARNKMSLETLLKNNPNIKNQNLIYPGDKINVLNSSNNNLINRVSTNYIPVVSDSYGNKNINNNFYNNAENQIKQKAVVSKVNTPKALPNKKQQTVIPINNEKRHLESGMIEDKNKNLMYVIKNNKVVKTFPIITGSARNGNINNKSTVWMENHPKESKKYKATPTGTYISRPAPNIYGRPGFKLDPIAAFGEPAPLAVSLAQHAYYGINPNPGQEGYDPAEGKRRLRIMAGPGEKRNASYGCTNMYGQDIDCLTGQLFPKGDTTIIVDTRIPKDKRFIQSIQRELGGTAIHPAMRTNFKQGGYYGMDGKLHKAKGSGTYVMNGGYYFDEGGTSTAPPVASPDTPPGAMGDPMAVPQSSLNYNMPNPDGSFNVNNDYNYDYGDDMEDNSADDGSYQPKSARAQRRQAKRNIQYETPDLGGLDENQFEEQPEEEVTAEPFDASNYSSAIDPSTGFVTYAKNNKTLTNIKKQDPALWQQLKDEGKGARFRTGQTDIQKVGRAAGRLANNLEMGVNIANAAGQLLNNKFQQRSLNNAAINKGSTASMYTNPQGAGKGDFGQTGSSYGMTDPTSVGARSFKGMYGKYGMEVPKYDIGGGFSNLFTSAQSVIPISNPISLMPTSVSFTGNSGFNPFQTNMPIVESTGVSTQKFIPEPETVSESDNNLKNLISKKESGGNYKALPWIDKAHTKLASSAVGKYQFLWGHHKNSIEKVTGVKTKEEFRNNPNAQEQFFDYWDKTTLTPWANKIKSQLKVNVPINKIKAAIHFSGPGGAWNYFSKGKLTKDAFGSTTSSYMGSFKFGGEQFGGQVMEMDENEIKQFLKAGGQLEFLD